MLLNSAICEILETGYGVIAEVIVNFLLTTMRSRENLHVWKILSNLQKMFLNKCCVCLQAGKSISHFSWTSGIPVVEI